MSYYEYSAERELEFQRMANSVDSWALMSIAKSLSKISQDIHAIRGILETAQLNLPTGGIITQTENK